MIYEKRDWASITNLTPKSYTCGYSGCGREVSSEKGWYHNNEENRHADAFIYICPNCKLPTFFDLTEDGQVPGVSTVGEVLNLPPDIQQLWSEIRKCMSSGACTSAVLAGRKLLMHIAVAQKAQENDTFLNYVNYLVSNHFAPPNSKSWVDSIRLHGNEATHEIIIKSVADATEIVTFLEMLLKFIYEFPAKGKKAV